MKKILLALLLPCSLVCVAQKKNLITNKGELVPMEKYDSTIIRNLINLKVNYTDTAAMLLAYKNTLLLKLNISDTAVMLAAYGTAISLRLKYTDTSSMLAAYQIAINSKQPQLNGTGFVKAVGTTISYDNNTYLTTAGAGSTYLPLAGGTMVGNIIAPAGSIGNVTYGVNNTSINGIYGPGGNSVGISTNGVQRFYIDATTANILVPTAITGALTATSGLFGGATLIRTGDMSSGSGFIFRSASSTGTIRIGGYTTGTSNEQWLYDVSTGTGTYYPQGDNTNDLGKTAQRIKTGYFGTGIFAGNHSIKPTVDVNSNVMKFASPGASGGYGGGFTFFGGINGTESSAATMRIYAHSTTSAGSTYFGNVSEGFAQSGNATTNVGVLNKITTTTTYDNGLSLNPSMLVNIGNYTYANNKQFGIFLGGSDGSNLFQSFDNSGQFGAFIGMQAQPLVNGYGTSLVFSAKDESSNEVEVMRLLGRSGNVGIGLALPLSKLHIAGTGATGGSLVIGTTPVALGSQAATISSPNTTNHALLLYGQANQTQNIFEVRRSDDAPQFSVGQTGGTMSGAWTMGGGGSFAISTGGTGNDMLRLNNVATNGKSYYLGSTNAGKFTIRNNTTGNDRLTIDSLGVTTITGSTTGGGYRSLAVTTLVASNGGGISLQATNGTTETPSLLLKSATGANSFEQIMNGNRLYNRYVNTSGVQSQSVFMFTTDNRPAKFAVMPNETYLPDASIVTKAMYDGGSALIATSFSATQTAPIFRVTNGDGTANFMNVVGTNVGIGTATPTTARLVVSGALSAAVLGMDIITSSSTGQSTVNFTNATGQVGSLFKTSASYVTYKNITASDFGIYNGAAAGDMVFLNDATSGKIEFAAGGSSTSQMTLTTNGNLGIGISPSSAFRLDVNGTGFFENGIRLGNAYSAIDVETGTSGLYLSGAQGALNHVFISGAGNVGIGTASPAYDIQLSKTTAGAGVWLNNRNLSASGYSTFSLGNNSGATRLNIYNFGSSYGSTGQYQASQNLLESNGSLYLTATDFRFYSGSVGIGTTAPTSSLHTAGSFATAYVAKSADYTATISDNIIKVTATPVTITLPTAVGITGREYIIINASSGNITVATTSSQNIGNYNVATTLTIPSDGSYTLASDNAGWVIKNKF